MVSRMRVKNLLWLSLLCSLGVFSAYPVHFLPLSIEELSAQADLVAYGKVIRRSCQQDEAGRIFTRVELEVKEIWKGRLTGPNLTLVHGGGVLGERRTVVTGQADYAVGEEVVVFLVFNARGEGVTIGLRQGKFHVEASESGGEPVAANGFVHPPPAAGNKAASLAPTVNSSRTRVPLSELRQRVQNREVRP